MDEREILLADRDSALRTQVADYFRDSGYRVDTTDSAVHAFCTVLEKRIPVVLLGSDFDRKISAADLVHLLRKCNRRLAIILISDDAPVPVVRRLREEGIFYHALRPLKWEETEEIRQAVECALNRPRGNGRGTAATRPVDDLKGEEVPKVDLNLSWRNKP
jgi:DNA-binding NtrC family response regulator